MNLKQRLVEWWHKIPKPKVKGSLLFMEQSHSDEGICRGCRTPLATERVKMVDGFGNAMFFCLYCAEQTLAHPKMARTIKYGLIIERQNSTGKGWQTEPTNNTPEPA